jgi:hypothetical protein
VATPAKVVVPAPVEAPVPVEPVVHRPLVLAIDDEDADWEYELSALRADQETDRNLEHQLAVATTVSRRTA